MDVIVVAHRKGTVGERIGSPIGNRISDLLYSVSASIVLCVERK